MNMQVSMGKLMEAVDSLKAQGSTQGTKLEQISQDIHAAKTTVKVVGFILAAVITFSGWLINQGLNALSQFGPRSAEVNTMPTQAPRTPMVPPVNSPPMKR
jgi:hypothetical protein